MTLSDKLAVWQKDLIDMSKRNTLLYFKSEGARPSGLCLQGVDISNLFDQLVIRGSAISESAMNLHDVDDPLPMKRFERLRVQARDELKERGVQSLYIVFGLLEWYESEQSETPTLSPLLLIPISVANGGTRARYSITRIEDDEIEINPTLREQLETNFHLTLPTYGEVIESARQRAALVGDGYPGSELGSDSKKPKRTDVSIDEVLDAVREALSALPTSVGQRWTVRAEAYVGRFSFQKLVMRHDLVRHQEEALAHPMLRRLGGEHDALREPRSLISAESLDTLVHPKNTLEILDADSSQQEAIQAAKSGQNFVLQGPPGTGKSQTIANIIAEVLGQGKKVLFVSEKMAALDVVRRRLEAAGLGEFLLDLHDSKQNKREFIGQLDQAVKQARIAPSASELREWQSESDALNRRRDELNAYVRELHKKRFALGINAFEAYGRLAALADVQSSEFALAEDVESINPQQLDHMREALQQLLDYGDVLDSYWAHPWRETLLRSITREQYLNTEDHFGRLSACLLAADDKLTQLALALGEPHAARTFGWATYACERSALALESPLPPAHWFKSQEIERLRPVLVRAGESARGYRATHAALDGRYSARVYDLDHRALMYALTEQSEASIAMVRRGGSSDPHDRALTERGQLEERLLSTVALLRQLEESATRVADILGLPAATTLDEIEALLRQAKVVSTSPIPPKPWLDPDDYAEARTAAVDAADKAQWAQNTRSALRAVYLPAYFDADLAPIDTRFREHYDSIWRYLQPQYYLDMRTLRRYIQGQARSVDELKADVANLEKVHTIDRWCDDRRIEHARLLGRHYNGQQTDWTHVRDLVTWTDDYHTRFSTTSITEAVLKLVMAPQGARANLMAALEPLDAQWCEWEAKRTWLESAFHTDALLRRSKPTALPDVQFLADTLEHALHELRAYWQAWDTIGATRQAPTTAAWHDTVADLQQAQVAHGFDLWIAENSDQLAKDLGSDFSGVATDWERALTSLTWVEQFIHLYPDGMPQPLVERISRGDLAQTPFKSFRQLRKQTVEALQQVDEELQYAETIVASTSLRPKNVAADDTTLDAMRKQVNLLRSELPQLERWVKCGQRMMDCRALSLGPVIDDGLKRGRFPRDIVRIFDRRFYNLWVDAAHANSPRLRNFSPETQDRMIGAFRELDIRHMQLAQQRLITVLGQQRYNAGLRADQAGQSEFSVERVFANAYRQLVREASKKRSPAIREIVKRVQPALIELKPCWMMSPLTVSQFVDTAEPVFDLVIFDEASQVLTEEAICAILRGRQLIVVGDEKQLPPTSFFAKSLSDMADDDDDEQLDSAEQERTESILKEMLSADIHQYALKWHYRSRHESLIAFSNRAFYGDQLVTFPGPEKQHSDGVKFVYVADGVYDRSGTRTNRREAEQVVDLLLTLAQRDPDISLGVVALSGAQQNAIRDALVARFKAHPELTAIQDTLNEDSANADGFFIKNLESVQGDERDVVILSIGYGKDRTGQLHAQFGPVNRSGGERRLNVAVTRARKRMYVVSSIHASDINPTQSMGVKTLRQYLDYAERGPVALTVSPTAVADENVPTRFDSPFEQAVYDALRARGVLLDTQIGCSGYRIDLAARDPEQPDRYILGIECDGASYHSSKTARDRDRLRQAHLESLGWKIHRIWSADWYANPDREITRTLVAIREAGGMDATDRSSQRAG